ncbi:MAG: hypothetical protein IPK14_24280 [Blastocatellia bacterium]|nr:hypothetical protein [Blastocatellia bacterium]MBL8197111.1 hypothetical protein [Blastocatellia bacterium]MBN8721808.1 hypothetical protein [Acidobacteriota bacterium]
MTRLLVILVLSLFPSLALAQNLAQALTTLPKPVEKASDSTPVEVESDTTLVSVEVVDWRSANLFKNLKVTKTPETMVERASRLYQESLFQRQRFNETGQAIEMESDRLYYRRDMLSYTKGIILYRFFNGRMDLGIYRRNFAPANTSFTGKMQQDFGQGDSNAVLFRNGSRIFFSLRVKLP